MSTPVVVLLGVLIIAVILFAMWYLNWQAARNNVVRNQTGLGGIFQGLGQAVGSIGGVINL